MFYVCSWLYALRENSEKVILADTAQLLVGPFPSLEAAQPYLEATRARDLGEDSYNQFKFYGIGEVTPHALPRAKYIAEEVMLSACVA